MLLFEIEFDMECAFQYRKRYGLHAIHEEEIQKSFPPVVSIPQAVWIACNCAKLNGEASATMFQYRKRYGLHAIASILIAFFAILGGFQYRKRYGLHAIMKQLLGKSKDGMFQYRKRYGLHAISLWRTILRFYCKFQYRKRYGLHAI